MKVAIIFAVLLAIVLQEASGAICQNKCMKRVKTGCRKYYYKSYSYSYYYGYRYRSRYTWKSYNVCSGSKLVEDVCNEICTHGGWSNWSDFELYEECPVLCGGGKGLAVRTRECNNPAPHNGGNKCADHATEERNITCNVDSCENICPEKKSKHLKHKDVAANFYQCDPNHKKAFLKECPEGTVFSESTETCVHSTTQHGSCTMNQKIPDPEDCGKYLTCVHGEFIEAPCSPGLHFNVIAQVCDWPASAGCETNPQ